ncbi:MAG: hypothetical protein QM785_01340 [Pyrinomonadaceae bacterium]
MKAYLLIVLIFASLLGFGCAPSGDIKMNIEKKTDAFTATHGVIKPASKATYRGHDAVFYNFFLSNFDMKLDSGQDERYGPTLTSKEQKKIKFSVIAIDLDQGFGTKLREGVYSSPFAAEKDITPGLELGSYRVYYFGDSGEEQFARLGATKESWVNITSVKEDVIEGEVHFIDGEDNIEGKFTAKMPKESGS